MVVHGAIDLYHFVAQFTSAPDPEHPTKRFLWLTGLGLIFFGRHHPGLTFVPSVFAIYIGLYLLFDGVTYLFTAGQGRTSPTARARDSWRGRHTHGDPSAEGTACAPWRCRHSGAMGMGHAGWAFEWPNGWFNCGLVEEPLGAAYTPAGKADFWTANTEDPVATMVELGPAMTSTRCLRVPNRIQKTPGPPLPGSAADPFWFSDVTAPSASL